MMASPGVIALLVVALLLAAYAGYAAIAGLRLLAGWEPGSAAEPQLRRERKTSLLSALLALTMGVDLLCLIVFVALTDRLHGLIPGAMCAAGMLDANAYGYPTLLTLLTGFTLGVLWLMINHLDSRTPGFCLIRLKYWALVPVALILSLQAGLLATYFAHLSPSLITSCCATFFNDAGTGIGAELAHLPPAVMQPLFWGGLAVTLGSGFLSLWKRATAPLYAGLSALMLPLGIASVISFIGVCHYQLPTHHCPFCLVQPEYGCVGLPLYAGLLLGSLLGMGTGLVSGLGRQPNLRPVASRMMRPLILWSLAGYTLFALVAVQPWLCSDFTLQTPVHS